MQLRGDDESFLDGLATLFDLALRLGDATCVIAPELLRQGLGDRLRARGWDVGGLSGHKRYLAVDASDALNRFMRNGLPDASILAEGVKEMDQYRLAVAERPTSRLTIFGTMAGLPLRDGNEQAAIALEKLWTKLTQGLPFLTICGYPTSCFHGGVPDFVSTARTEHWALSHG
jgi:hypothetical protein